jgi:hypothetical protein
MKLKLIVSILIICKVLYSQININDNYIFYKDIPYYKNTSDTLIAKRCLLDIAVPKNKKNDVVIVWFHGGGLSGGEKYFPNILLNGENIIVSASYRLYPNVKSPTYIYDAAAALSFVLENIEKYGGNKNKIVVSGHSAGGYLTLMIGMDNKYLNKFNHSNKEIKFLVPLSPQVITHFTIRKEKNISENTVVVDSLAPIYHLNKYCPPIHIICGDRNLELFGRYEENLYFYRMSLQNGKKDVYLYELQGFDHGDMVDPGCMLLLKIIRNFKYF